MSLQKNLKLLLECRHLNANSLSVITNGDLAQPTTRRILRGDSKNVRDNTLRKYAEFFDVGLVDLKYGDLFSSGYSMNLEGALAPDLPHNKIQYGGIVKLPCFREIYPESNQERSKVIEDIENSFYFEKDVLVSADVNQESAACAINHGNSMESTISNNALIAIDKSKNTIKDGKIYAFDYGGLLCIKRLFRLPFGAIRIACDNPRYSDEVVSAERWRDEVVLLGWVFWWSTVDKWQ